MASDGQLTPFCVTNESVRKLIMGSILKSKFKIVNMYVVVIFIYDVACWGVVEVDFSFHRYLLKPSINKKEQGRDRAATLALAVALALEEARAKTRA